MNGVGALVALTGFLVGVDEVGETEGLLEVGETEGLDEVGAADGWGVEGLTEGERVVGEGVRPLKAQRMCLELVQAIAPVLIHNVDVSLQLPAMPLPVVNAQLSQVLPADEYDVKPELRPVQKGAQPAVVVPT